MLITGELFDWSISYKRQRCSSAGRGLLKLYRFNYFDNHIKLKEKNTLKTLQASIIEIFVYFLMIMQWELFVKNQRIKNFVIENDNPFT